MPRTAVSAAWAVVAALSAGATPASETAQPNPPRIEGVTPLVDLSRAAEVCVCGHFPTPDSAGALRIDGRPLTVSGPFDERVVTLRLPPGLAPGPHTVTGAPDAGFDPGDRGTVRLVQINTKVCKPLPFGPRRRVHLIVAGTEEPVSLRVRNQTPSLVTLSGGSVLETTTSGGRHNQALVDARATGQPGRWTLSVELASPACPCAGAAENGVDPERQEELSRDLERSVAEVEGWFGELEPGLRTAARGGTLSHDIVLRLLDELERRLLETVAAPELAALRAWLEDRLAEERARWLPAPEVRGRVPEARRPRPIFAHLAPAALRQEAPTASALDGLVERVLALFQDLRAVSQDLVVDFCVRSLPSRSEVWVQPKRYEPGRRTKLTDTEFLKLTRGLYVGRVTRPGLPPREFAVDLVSEPSVYVECALEEGVCNQASRSAGFACRQEGGR